MAWAKNGTPDTLVSAGDTIAITDQIATTFNVALGHFIAVSGNVLGDFRLNADSGNNYASRKSNNGGADITTINDDGFPYGEISQPESRFGVCYFINISAEEKLMIRDEVSRQTAGAGNAPARSERVGKWVNTATQSSQMSLINTSAGSFDTDSNLSALGTD